MRIGLVWTAAALMATGTALGTASELHFPQPPRQHTAWKPDAKIPTDVVAAANVVFAQGFPDPRGCDYREIEVEVGNVWSGKSSIEKTHGWVLPPKTRETNRFAICWNGLIYPVSRTSDPADLRMDVSNAPPMRSWGQNAAGESYSVRPAGGLSTCVLLLLKAAEGEAALKRWTPQQERMRRNGEAAKNDPYLEFASDWAWALFDRTICAHMRGDTLLALATARQLAEVQPKIEGEAAKRGFPRQKAYDSWGRQDKDKPYLDFLGQLPELLADLERRAKESSLPEPSQSTTNTETNKSARIALLIRKLDQVQARQWSQPGGVNLPGDPMVAALIGEGDAAIEPLLDCLETDKRLTQSVGFHRDFFRNRSVIPVASAAWVAATSILHAGFNGGVTQMRAYWKKYKGLSLDERCYAILKDDSAATRWLEVAGYLVQSENVSTYPGGLSVIGPIASNRPVRLRGEALRYKSDPSVTELMARRALEVPATNPAAYDLGAASQMALNLAAWDPREADPVVKTLITRCRVTTEHSGQQLGKELAKLTLARARFGAPEAFGDYVAWLKTTRPEELEHSLDECLEPLRLYPTNEVLQPAAEYLFSRSNSPWSSLPWKGVGIRNPVESDLVKAPAFRRLLSRELDKRTNCGSIEWRPPNMASFQLTNYMSGSRGLDLPEQDKPPAGTKVEIRWCDWIAWLLASGKQIPPFNPFAPIAQRDRELNEAKVILETTGSR